MVQTYNFILLGVLNLSLLLSINRAGFIADTSYYLKMVFHWLQFPEYVTAGVSNLTVRHAEVLIPGILQHSEDNQG